MAHISRRRLLTTAGAVAAGSLLPPSLHEAIAETPSAGAVCGRSSTSSC